VLLKVGDKITTDHIMPAGAYLKYRSNIPRYAQVVFECFNEPGKPSFAQRASALRDSGRAGVILAGESYGQGSSREHAAICPMFLGIRVILALSIERIHAANLVNFGILPLLLKERADYARLEAGDSLRLEHLPAQLRAGSALAARMLRADGTEFAMTLTHALSGEDVEMVLKGGRLA
jgi:aconitate hydratase